MFLYTSPYSLVFCVYFIKLNVVTAWRDISEDIIFLIPNLLLSVQLHKNLFLFIIGTI